MTEYIGRLDASTIPVLPVEQRVQFKTVDEAFEEGWRQALEMVAMMEPADVVERPRWIPVEERLPELPDLDYYSVVVIAYPDKWSSSTPMTFERIFNRRTGKREERWVWHNRIFHGKVACWQPLPKPPAQ